MKWFWQKTKKSQDAIPAVTSATALPQDPSNKLNPTEELVVWALTVDALERESSAEEAGVVRSFLMEAARKDLKGNVTGLTALGRRLKAESRFAEAEVVYRLTAAIASELGEANPLYGMAVGNLGVFLDERGRRPEAEPQYRQSLELFRRTPLREHNPPYAHTLQRLGELYEATARPAEARKCYEEVAALRRPRK